MDLYGRRWLSMIRRVSCDKPSFKSIEFKEGFNVVLADTTESSTEKDSRNGLGKSTLIEIIHFCLGYNPKKGSILKSEELKNWTFTLDLTLNGKEVTVSRNTTNKPSKIRVKGDFSDWAIKPEYDTKLKEYVIPYKKWINLLGNLMFGLPLEFDKPFSPTFRSLISYFSRKGLQAYADPFKHHPNQKEWDIQVNNAYLLGLNWEYAAEFQILKEEKNKIKELINAVDKGLLEGYVGSKGELEAKRVELEEQIQKLEKELKSFKIHPEYHSIEEKVNNITKQIQEITNDMILNKRILNQYEEAIKEEHDVPLDEVKTIYNETGVVFPDMVQKHLEQVIEFHKNIIYNRRKYLEDEINSLKLEINKQDEQIRTLDAERAEYMQILKTNRALDEYVELTKLLAKYRQELESVIQAIKNLDKFEEGMSNITIKKEELFKKAKRDYEERKPIIDNAIRLFNEASKYLYSEPGILSIDVTKSGYKFNVDIKRAQSQGVSYMKVFCYDMTLIQLWIDKIYNPGFLIHDSTIFDGVDERQVARALELAMEKSDNKGFQYICTMNSDTVPYHEFGKGFKNKFDQSIVARFTDATPDGGLLGIRF